MNILYITVDALRADHVTKEVMPTANSFVNDAISFAECYANGPGTPWSFPALLSSRDSGAVEGFGISEGGDGHPTLAEALTEHGYATAGFTDNRFVSSDYNYDRGINAMYDSGATSEWKRLKQVIRTTLGHDGVLYQTLLRSYHVVDDLLLNLSGKESRFVRSADLVEQLLSWVETQNEEWFAWLHPMDTHAPYEAPEQYQVQYLDDPVPRQRSQELARKATHHPDELTDEEWQLQRDLYKAECTYLDDQLEFLFDSLSEEVIQETVVVLTADHGEMHGEHGLGGHPQQFWEEVIHVPCAISIPDRQKQSLDGQIGLVDLPPTLLDTVGIGIPEAWDGNSMLPDPSGEFISREHLFVDVGAELNRDHAGLRRADGWKLMRHGQNGELLLDLTSNPDEDPGNNRIADEPDVFDEMAHILDNHLDEMEKRRSAVSGVEDEEMIEDHLKELGYLE